MKIIDTIVDKVKSLFGDEKKDQELHPEEPGYGALRIQPQEDDEEDQKIHTTMERIGKLDE